MRRHKVEEVRVGTSSVRCISGGLYTGDLHDFFFFQAEDGIRDVAVTGVQTCALPISTCRTTRTGTPVPPPACPRKRDGPQPMRTARHTELCVTDQRRRD